MLSLALKIKILSILAKNSWKIEIEPFRRVLFHRKTTVCLKYFGQDCTYKQKKGLIYLKSWHAILTLKSWNSRLTNLPKNIMVLKLLSWNKCNSSVLKITDIKINFYNRAFNNIIIYLNIHLHVHLFSHLLSIYLHYKNLSVTNQSYNL